MGPGRWARHRAVADTLDVRPAPPWWRDGVVYQIYPRSFADSGGDGIGDLEGIRRHVDHLTWLGVDAVWLSPIYPSPMADFGYDVSDYEGIDPVFGDLATFDRLLAELHANGLRLMLDWVPNHTSDRHPWFVASRSSRTDPKRAWYVWRDGRDGAEPNNWRAAFGGRAWTLDEATGQWYLHLFLPEQPDLDWGNPEVEAAMHAVLRCWLDRGVDGFRADVVHLIGKDSALHDLAPEVARRSPVGIHDYHGTHGLLRGIRAVLDGYPGERAMVGEVNLGSARLLAPYYGDGDELHLVFNFTLLRAPWDAMRWAEVIEAAEAAFDQPATWPVWVLGNHDVPRLRTRYGGDERRARVAAAVLLTLRGTPFLYGGDELGLLDAEVPPERVVDPGRRDGCRAPIPWVSDGDLGWPGEPWLPWPPEAGERSVTAQREDQDSVLWLHRRLLRARRASPALRAGTWQRVAAPDDLLAYERAGEGDVRRVVANFGDTETTVAWSGTAWRVEVATSVVTEGHLWDGTMTPVSAAVLVPAT